MHIFFYTSINITIADYGFNLTNMAEDAEQSSSSLSTSEEFEIVGGLDISSGKLDKFQRKIVDKNNETLEENSQVFFI